MNREGLQREALAVMSLCMTFPAFTLGVLLPLKGRYVSLSPGYEGL